MKLDFRLHHDEELDEEQRGDHIRQRAHVLGLAGEHLDEGVGDEAEADGVADGAGDRHTDEHDRHGQHLVHIAEVHILEALEHQNADIDERSGGRSAGNDGGDGREEHAGEEQHRRSERGKSRAAARFHAGGGLNEGRDGRGAGAGARDRTDGVGEQGFLHVGHVALFIDHAGAGGRADEGADGVEHVDHAEGDDESDGGEPADVHKARKVKLEQRGGDHVGKGRDKACRCKACKGIHVQEDGAARPVDDGGEKHTEQHRRLHALLGKNNHDEHAEEGRHNGEDHRMVAHLAHAALDDAGRERAEEVAHHVEGAAVFRVDTDVGAKAHVHQHETDGGGDAVAHAEGDGLDDLLAHL